MTYDLVIRDGVVVDGTGGEPFRADVAIVGNRIVAIGDLDGSATAEVDAEGQVVTPGFIDAHTHMDAQVMWDEHGTCSCWHGVTTVVMGNCGFSLAPVDPAARALVVRSLERAEDISLAAMDQGITWGWETFAEYLDGVDRRQHGINYAAYVGHSALRTWVMGERAFVEEATGDDLDRMDRELRRSLAAGAVGFSTSRSANHETSDDRPVASRLASWDEVRRLVGVMGTEGRGVFELALEPAAQSRDDEVRLDFLGRLKALAVDTGVPITFGLLAGLDRPLIEFIDEVTEAGGVAFGQTHSRGVANMFSFSASTPFDVLDEWREVRALPRDEQIRALRDPATRARLVATAQHGEYARAIGAEARKPRFERLYIMDSPIPPWRTVESVAHERGLDPMELVIDLAANTGLDQFFFQPLTAEDPERILPYLKYPRSVMTFSDSGAHVSQISDSSIQTHFLAYWVRERQDFTLAEGVRMLTAAPAGAWGLRDRGLFREGMIADINVFDADRIAPTMPHVAHDLPGGARRLLQGAEGIKATIVAGEVVIEDGAFTDRLPGRLLRDAGWHQSVVSPNF